MPQSGETSIIVSAGAAKTTPDQNAVPRIGPRSSRTYSGKKGKTKLNAAAVTRCTTNSARNIRLC
jgi:hypothetical protein